MFYKKFLLPITGSFITGFGSAYLILKKDFKLNDILNFSNSPLYAATINTNAKDIVPYNLNEIKPGSVDDLATCRGNKTSEIMRHGYPTLGLLS